MIVGDSVVGKKEIGSKITKRIVDDDSPDVVKGSVVDSLDMGALLASTK